MGVFILHIWIFLAHYENRPPYCPNCEQHFNLKFKTCEYCFEKLDQEQRKQLKEEHDLFVGHVFTWLVLMILVMVLIRDYFV